MTNDELGVISFQLSAQVVGLADGVNKYMAEESGIFLADLEGFARTDSFFASLPAEILMKAGGKPCS